MGDKDYIDEFIRKTLDDTLWIEKADHLLEVASFIEPRIDEMWSQVRIGGPIKQHYITTYFMLVAYALENLLKALYIKLNGDLVKRMLKEKKRLPKPIAGHDLYQLARELGVVNLEWGEESLLKKLSRSAVWFGRYPTPIMPSQLERFHKSEFEDLAVSFSSYSPNDRKEIQNIISRVRNKLKSD
jgi:hypothetical protein